MAYNILLIYFIILSIFDIFIIKQKKNKFLILTLAFLGYLFFFGFRGFIAWDWKNYYPNYINVIPLYNIFQNGEIKLNNIYTSFEIGYQIWLSFFKIFFSNWNMYLFFTTLIDILCLLFIFHKYSPYPIFSILLFLGFNGLQIQLDLMRNLKAILIFLFSIEYLINNKNIKYIILNFLSSSFHRSCLMYLIMGYFLKKNFYKYKKIILVFFIFGIFFFLFSSNILYEILNTIRKILTNTRLNVFDKLVYKLNTYLFNDYASARGIGIGFIERIFTFFIFYIYREKINKNKYGKIFFNIYLLYISSYLYGSGVRIIFERLGFLFICSYWILYPITLKNISKIKKIFLFFILVIFCGLKINIYTNFSLKAKELYKYRNILWDKEIYEKKLILYNKVFERYDITNKR